MVDLPDTDELAALEAFQEPFCLSIYAPLIDPNAASNPNAIELKNLLREATTALTAAGVRPRIVEQTLRPARALMAEGGEFWPHHHESLALFMHPKLFRQYHVPDHDTPYLLTVGTGFNLDPLLTAVRHNKVYLVLALGHKDVALYRGDEFHVQAVRINGLPADMESTLNIDEYPSIRELHDVGPAYLGKRSEGYHGQYNPVEVDKDMLLEFFRVIDHRLHRYLETTQLPLILAGVDYVTAMYREVNTYPKVWPTPIAGTIRRMPLDDIRSKAWTALTGR